MKRSLTWLAIAGATAALTLAPLAAQAHDAVVGTSPSADGTVAAGVVNLSVTFNESIMATPDNSGESIFLAGPDNPSGVGLGGTCLEVNGATMSTKLDLDQPGKYTVHWRSVSNDGHPSEGSFEFTLTNDNGYQSKGMLALTGQPCAVAIVDAVATPYDGQTDGQTATEEPVLISASIPADWARDGGPAESSEANQNSLNVGIGFASLAGAMLIAFYFLVASNRRR